MRNSITRRAKILLSAIVIVLLIVGMECLSAGAGAESAPSTVREVKFTYHTDIAGIDPKAHKVEAWIPLPRDDRFQRVSELVIDSPVHAEVIKQPTGGNRVAHLSAAAPLPASIPVTIRFTVRRVEEAANPAMAQRNLPEPRDGKFASYLSPDRLVPINGEITRVSAKVGDTDASAYEQAHAIYRYVIANMTYDKSGTGWGRGDAIYACNVKKGNCTDFHSLFIAIARSRGIPARFTIGFPLGSASAGTIPGYHCWAEFYAGGQWVPVDASEAWKHPQLVQYYFGHLDASRVAFTMGRDLVLKPPQQGEPLNFLIYPYVEVDGKPLPKEQVKNKFDYAPGGAS
jgi:transglutaminase-like putative cysteine protease